MKSIRIGNDILIRWSIVKDYEKYDLTGKDIDIELVDSFGTRGNISWETEDNVAVIMYRGCEQHNCGTYHLTLYENRGEDGMVTLDSCDAFKLVSRTQCCPPDGGCDCGRVEVSATALSLVSNIDYAAFSPVTVDDALSGTSTNPVQNKVVTEALEGKQDVLVSGESIKTINGEPILGAGDIEIAGSTVEVDDALSDTSENPVQNRVITAALEGKQEAGDYLTEESLTDMAASDAEAAEVAAGMDI